MTPRSLLAFAVISAMSVAGCSAPAMVVAPAKLPAMPFQQLGTVAGTSQSYAYNSGLFSYNQLSPLRWYSDASNGAYTPGNGNTISFSFFGSGMHLYGSLQARGCPNIPVTVDGVGYTMSCLLATVSKVAPQYDQTLLDIPTLPVTNHAVTITNPTRGKYIYFTRAVLDQPPPINASAVVNPGSAYAGPPVWGP
ncbi:MAG: hypothetical protein H7338_21450 [Candidatus Sericytochromatia bacterium]|nr:hypothetical protein [Candidatus Sericytochromatia bacterium]